MSSWLLSVSSGWCLGYSPCLLGYSPCLQVGVLVTLRVFLVTLRVFRLVSWLLSVSSWLLSVSSVLIPRHFPWPQNNTRFPLALKIRIFFLVEKDDVIHAVFKMVNSCLAFPILIFICSTFVCHYTTHMGKCVVFLYVFP